MISKNHFFTIQNNRFLTFYGFSTYRMCLIHFAYGAYNVNSTKISDKLFKKRQIRLTDLATVNLKIPLRVE